MTERIQQQFSMYAEDIELIERIGEMTGIRTMSGTVRHVINDYARRNGLLNGKEKEHVEGSEEVSGTARRRWRE